MEGLAGVGEGNLRGGEVVLHDEIVGEVAEAEIFGQVGGELGFGDDGGEPFEGVFTFFKPRFLSLPVIGA